MRTSWRHLIPAVALAAPLAALAVDSPHDASFSSGSCTECHALHQATGGTGAPTNADLCLTCHNQPGRSPRVTWQPAEQATLGVSGKHHRWDAATTNAAAGALPPQHPAMAARVPGNVLQCATCHDLHKANAANAPGSVAASIPVGVAQNKTGGTGTGTLTLQALPATPAAAGYRVKLSATGITISHNANIAAPATPTWLNYVGGVWQVGSDGGAGKPFTPGTAVTLDGANPVSIVLSAGTAAGDYWDFYVSYPFVRAFNAAGEMCIDCHRDRAQDHFTTRGTPGYGWGGLAFSHPVYQALGDNGEGTDRTAPLDANGALQGTAGVDANPTNDLVLSSGQVTCLSCHAPHAADSNSLTVDLR
jgi:predicted CXXCH cytochrome family protein